MQHQIEDALRDIDSVLRLRMSNELPGLHYGLGGCSMYLSNRGIQLGSVDYHNDSIDVLEKIVLGANLGTPTEYARMNNPVISSFWLVDQYIKKQLLDEEEKTDSKILVDLIRQSTSDAEFQGNYHDLFFGFIGKANMLIETDPYRSQQYIQRVIDALRENAITDHDGLFWETPEPFWPSADRVATINFGIAHGIPGIILFLIKCGEIYGIDFDSTDLVNPAVRWLIRQLDKPDDEPPVPNYKGTRASGKLAWCYGDLSIAYALLRHHEVFNDEKSKSKAYELINRAMAKPFAESCVKFFPKYEIWDVGLCHGTSSVAYMFKKMAEITGDQAIRSHAEKWLLLTIESIKKQLHQFDVILQDEKPGINTTMGFLEGLSGVGLVLISFLRPDLSYWDKLLLLDRHAES